VAASSRHAPVWQDRNFLPLWVGLLVSNLGDWVAYIAMYAVAYQQTQSALALVGLRLIHLVPEFLFAPFAGVLVDRWSRKTTLVVAPLVSSVAVALLAVTHPTILILVAEAVITAAVMFFEPAVSASIPNIVAEDELTQANTLTRVTNIVATTVGGLVGGVLASTAGGRPAFLFDAVSFLAIAVLISGIHIRTEQAPPVAATTMWRDLREGINYLLTWPVVGTIVVVGALFVLIPSTLFTVGIVFSRSALHAGAAGYGVILAAGGAGSFIAAVWMLLARPRAREDVLFGATGVAQGALVIVMGLSHSLPVAATLYGIADGLSTITGVSSLTLIQRRVPDALRGRVFGVASSLNHLAAIAAAVFVAGGIGVLGASGLISVSGAITLVAGGVVLVIVCRRGRSR
jgi:MFS family permease